MSNIENRVGSLENNLVQLAMITKESNDRNLELTSLIQNIAEQINTEKATSNIVSLNAEHIELVEQMKSRIEKIEETNQNIIKENQELKTEITKVKEVTYVLLTDDPKQKELTNAVSRRAYKFAGRKDTPKNILFYRDFIGSCYSHLYSIFGVRSYKRIKIDDFDMALKAVDNWYPTQASINKKLHEYIDLQDKGLLPPHKSNALNLYLEEINGGVA